MSDGQIALRDDRARVWIVEDDAGYRANIQEEIQREEDLKCDGAFGSGEELFEHLNQHFAPEVVLVDIGLPEMSGVEVVSRFRIISPATARIMLTVHKDDDNIFRSIVAGASGYLPKGISREELMSAIRDVLRGGAAMTPEIADRVFKIFTQLHAPRWDYGLTEKEKEVLHELAQGKSKRQIADSVTRSMHTVDTHLRNIYMKLHVHSKSAAVAKALKENLVSW